jgi:hypothetical protein
VNKASLLPPHPAPPMRRWEADKTWADRFLPNIRLALANHLIGVASEEDDRERATDLITLAVRGKRVGCRVRRPDCLNHPHYLQQFTIRLSRPSGNETELAKIVSGWGDLFFYGFSDRGEASLARWVLIDLFAFRLAFARRLNARRQVFEKKNNADGSSSFAVFSLADYPPEMVVDCFGFTAAEVEALGLGYAAGARSMSRHVCDPMTCGIYYDPLCPLWLPPKGPPPSP